MTSLNLSEANYALCIMNYELIKYFLKHLQ